MGDERNPGEQPGQGQGGQGEKRPNEQEQQQEKRRAPGSGDQDMNKKEDLEGVRMIKRRKGSVLKD